MKFWFFFVSLCAVVLCHDGPEVETSSGKLEGKYMVTKLGRKFSGFLAIPFAKPPLESLRFKVTKYLMIKNNKY